MSEHPKQPRMLIFGLVIIAVSSFYSVYLFRHWHESQDDLQLYGTVGEDREPFPEHSEEIEQVYDLLNSTDIDEGKNKFKDLSDKVVGGEDWVLLKLSVLDNSRKDYKSFPESEKPVLEITPGKNSGSTLEITAVITNTKTSFINFARVPSKVVWSLTGPGGSTKTIKGNPELFGNPDNGEVVKLTKESFWGVKLPLKTEGLESGEWTLRLKLVYEEKELQGMNLVYGEIISNAQKIGL